MALSPFWEYESEASLLGSSVIVHTIKSGLKNSGFITSLPYVHVSHELGWSTVEAVHTSVVSSHWDSGSNHVHSGIINKELPGNLTISAISCNVSTILVKVSK
jgi:hypothetical protein